jgi:hypothetical protein
VGAAREPLRVPAAGLIEGAQLAEQAVHGDVDLGAERGDALAHGLDLAAGQGLLRVHDSLVPRGFSVS